MAIQGMIWASGSINARWAALPKVRVATLYLPRKGYPSQGGLVGERPAPPEVPPEAEDGQQQDSPSSGRPQGEGDDHRVEGGLIQPGAVRAYPEQPRDLPGPGCDACEACSQHLDGLG